MFRKNALKSFPSFYLMLAVIACNFACLPAIGAAVFNVKDFGAVGDGKTNDQGAIQQALNTASASPGNTVYFPAGSYKFFRLLIRDVAVLGQSKDSVILIGNICHMRGDHVSITNMTITGGGPGRQGLVDDKSASSTYSNLALIGKNRVPGILLNVLPLNRRQPRRSLIVENCEFSGFFNHIISTFCDQTTIKGNTFKNSFGPGAWIISSTNLNAESNTYSAPDDSSFNTGFFVYRCSNVLITNNQIQDASAGVVCREVQNLNIRKNNLQRIFRIGIDLDICAGTVDDNTIQLLAQSASAGTSFKFTGTLQITNNRISNCGFGIVGDSNGACDITGNTIERTAQSGINVSSRNTYKIDSNTLRDCGLLRPPSSVIIARRALPPTAPQVTNNAYTGGVNNLTYFIRCEVPSPPSVVSGNTTTTMLPTYVRP